MTYDLDYVRFLVNPKRGYGRFSKTRILPPINRIFRRTLNIEKCRVIIDDEHYFIDKDIIVRLT